MIFQYIPNEQILMRSITVTRYPSFSGIPQYHLAVDTVTHIIHHYIHLYPHDIPQVGWFSNQPCGCWWKFPSQHITTMWGNHTPYDCWLNHWINSLQSWLYMQMMIIFWNHWVNSTTAEIPMSQNWLIQSPIDSWPQKESGADFFWGLPHCINSQSFSIQKRYCTSSSKLYNISMDNHPF